MTELDFALYLLIACSQHRALGLDLHAGFKKGRGGNIIISTSRFPANLNVA